MTDKLIKIAVCWVTSAVLLYLAGAFMATNFDITMWGFDGRIIAAVVWLILAAAAVPAIIAGEEFL